MKWTWSTLKYAKVWPSKNFSFLTKIIWSQTIIFVGLFNFKPLTDLPTTNFKYLQVIISWLPHHRKVPCPWSRARYANYPFLVIIAPLLPESAEFGFFRYWTQIILLILSKFHIFWSCYPLDSDYYPFHSYCWRLYLCFTLLKFNLG